MHATAVERQRIYESLRLDGVVRLDPAHGLKLGRRHRFTIEWRSVFELLNDTREIKKTRVEYFTDEYADWEQKFLGEVKIRLDGIPMQEPTPAAASRDLVRSLIAFASPHGRGEDVPKEVSAYPLRCSSHLSLCSGLTSSPLGDERAGQGVQ